MSLKASGLKDEVAKKLKGDVLDDVEVEVPSAGSNMKDLQGWDFSVVSKKKTGASYDGLDVLLYGPGSSGGGDPKLAGNTIPTAKGPAYGFALSLRANVFLKYIDEMLDRKGYYTQKADGARNTPSNPYGYMIVPKNGKSEYTLPGPHGGTGKKVTVSEPTSGVVKVTIPDGGLSPRSRATLTNHVQGRAGDPKVSFEADSDGAASVSISATDGARLGISVQGVSSEKNPKAVVFCPQFSLHDNKIGIRFNYYYHIDDWCDAAGGGWVGIVLKADRSQAFSVTADVTDKNIDLPWWADFLGFIAGLLTGGVLTAGVGGAPVGGLLGGLIFLVLVDAIGGSIVSGIVAEKLEKELTDQLKFPTPGGGKLALFLERVDLYRGGVVLSGYADAGIIVHYGRQEACVDPTGVLKLGSGREGFTLHFDRPSGSAGPTVKCYWPYWSREGTGEAAEFVKAAYEAGADKSFVGSNAVLNPGKPTLLWVKHDRGLAKVLLEWDASTEKVRATWVFFKARVTQYVKIDNNVTQIAAGSSNIIIGYWICYRYDGWLELETRKFFRTAITREAGLERWFWDGKEIKQDGSVTDVGLKVTWDTKNDRIVVDIDQSSLAHPLPQTPSDGFTAGVRQAEHVLKYQGEDAFGTKKETQVKLSLPDCVSGTLKLLYDIKVWPYEILPDPPWMQRGLREMDRAAGELLGGSHAVALLPREQLTELLTARLAEQPSANPLVLTLAQTISTALKEGSARLDSQSAQILLSMLGDRAEPEQGMGEG